MPRTSYCILLAILLPLLAGCPQVGNIRIADDSPETLEYLIAQHEYMYARQLTAKYP